MNLTIIEQALIEQVRIQTNKGLLSVEQLFALPLEESLSNMLSLNGLAQSINTTLQNSKNFLQPSVKTDAAIKAERELALVVRIIEIKVEKKKEKEDSAYKQGEAARLRAELQKRDASKYENLSSDELQARLASLEADK